MCEEVGSRVCEGEREREHVRAREKQCVCVSECVRVRERVCVSVCICVFGGEEGGGRSCGETHDSQRECVYMYVHVHGRVYAHVCLLALACTNTKPMRMCAPIFFSLPSLVVVTRPPHTHLLGTVRHPLPHVPLVGRVRGEVGGWGRDPKKCTGRD